MSKHEVKPGRNEQFDFTTYSGSYEGIQVNRKYVLPKDRLVVALTRLKAIGAY